MLDTQTLPKQYRDYVLDGPVSTVSKSIAMPKGSSESAPTQQRNQLGSQKRGQLRKPCIPSLLPSPSEGVRTSGPALFPGRESRAKNEKSSLCCQRLSKPQVIFLGRSSSRQFVVRTREPLIFHDEEDALTCL